MNADKVEHRGMVAHQSYLNNAVLLYKDGERVTKVRTTERQTAEDMKRLIDEFLDNRKEDVK